MAGMQEVRSGVATHADWATTISRAPDIERAFGTTILKSWAGTSPVMVQPPLSQHYVVVHLGGHKRVTRRGHGAQLVRDVREGAVTLVPAGARFNWVTEGPIAFAHLYLDPRTLDTAVVHVSGRDPRLAGLHDLVGLSEPVLMAAMRRLLHSGAGSDCLAFETALADVLTAVVMHGTSAGSQPEAAIRIGTVRLRRVLDFVEDNLGGEISLAGMAAVAGLSPFHFARAFRAATGRSPNGHVVTRRMHLARQLLSGSPMPVEQVAAACGYASHSRFSARFRAETGVSPSRYRG